MLLEDEQRPLVLERYEPHTLVWSSLSMKQPDARMRFNLPSGKTGAGTDLWWNLLLGEPLPDAALLGHLHKLLTMLINGNLRYSVGQ